MQIAAKQQMGDRINIVTNSKEFSNLKKDSQKFADSKGADELTDSLTKFKKTIYEKIKVDKYAPHSTEMKDLKKLLKEKKKEVRKKVNEQQ